ncbi:MAG TPA: restriction endonuclease [Symbiobacteriaceae bacterium]
MARQKGCGCQGCLLGHIVVWATFVALAPIVLVVKIVQKVMLKKRNAVHEEEERKTIQAILPEISTFVSLWIPNVTWPTMPEIPDDEIAALHTIFSEKGCNLPIDLLKQTVDRELERQVAIRFATSFEQAAGWTQQGPTPLTVDRLAEAYVQCFVENRRHVRNLLLYAKMVGLDCSLGELNQAVDRVIAKRVHERKVAELKERLTPGTRAAVPRITIEQIDKMTGSEFEQFLEKLFSAMGYETVVTKATRDHGADLVLKKFGEITVVQAKRYGQSVGNRAVQEVVAAKGRYNAHHAIVVTNSTFTPAARELAASNKVELLDRQQLEELIQQYLN